MSLFSTVQAAPPAALPKATQQALTSRLIRSTAAQQYRRLCEMQKTGIDSVWGHQSLSPQEVFDSLGEAAGSLCAAHAALTKCIVTIATADGIAPDIKLPTFNFAVESDGKVTVSDTPYAP